jgi:hypothetical protein
MATIDLSEKTYLEPKITDGGNVVVGSGTARLFTADGFLPLADYYPLTPTVSGAMNVVLQQGYFAVQGVTVYKADGTIATQIDAPLMTRRAVVSGTFTTTSLDPVYAYINLGGRSPALFTVDVNAST